ncbi:MAG: valyl-tRNA synthetase [Myxococcaceae bacterium]|nr:valyl-tRNA synthetase [Myxococcaceae bacterium]
MSPAAEMPKAYDPATTERKWYAFWEEHRLFRASSDPADKRPTYVIPMPPPNITGTLHIGHACRTTFEDVLIRYHRMRGYNALWIPGTDHAGISAQVVVERQLKGEGTTRHELGREQFLERMWAWRRQSGDRILEQKRTMGASADWSRTKFTMDPDLSLAVREAFVRLYEEKLIYRATRLVNWDIVAQTVLSDLEVDTEENVEGELYEFAYPTEDGGEIVVATTRPETMVGDSGIAVHPDDPRYTHLHGKFAKHPFVDRRIPIILDAELVDMKFGTGAVKLTPAHDFNDFASGKRHGLEEINIFTLDGKVNENGGEFRGLDRFVARKAVKKRLAELGLERGSKKHMMTLPKSQRSGTIVEPLISTQWFMNMKPLAEPAIAAVESGATQIIPEDWTKTYYHWMRNIQDWCISRQLWWGHAIPAWYCQKCEHTIVSRTDPTACEKCGSSELKPDDDVLDTWFSSGLWPFSTLGWPQQTPDLAKFYPTSDLETGYDILFFWVARMMMMGIHFMGKPPFKRVLLAGMVTDENGDKMSKVKGNVIDPLDLIHGASLPQLLDKAKQSGASEGGLKHIAKAHPEGFAAYGSDAVRYTLLSYSPQARRIALSVKRIEGYRNFCNKLWNAARYAMLQLDGKGAVASGQRPAATLLINRWILSRLDVALTAADQGLTAYRLDDATLALYHFVWNELCDWYLELTKPLLAGSDEQAASETRAVLVHVLESVLRALHPMMPFITEEIWQSIAKADGHALACAVASYPLPDREGQRDELAEREMSWLTGVISAVRTIRAEHDIAPKKPIALSLRTDDAARRALFSQQKGAVETLCNATLVLEDTAAAALEHAATQVAEGVTILVPLSGLVDAGKEKERVGRELAKVEKDLAVLGKKLGNQDFVARAPAAVIAKDRERHAELETAREKLRDALTKLAS